MTTRATVDWGVGPVVGAGCSLAVVGWAGAAPVDGAAGAPKRAIPPQASSARTAITMTRMGRRRFRDDADWGVTYLPNYAI